MPVSSRQIRIIPSESDGERTTLPDPGRRSAKPQAADTSAAVRRKSAPVDKMFRAFSDRTRLRLLHLLTGGEMCVCDLVEIIAVPQPKISRHLAYLRKAGLVLARKQGLWSYYRLAPADGEFHAKLLDCLACCFKDVPELARDAKKRPTTKCAPGGKCC